MTYLRHFEPADKMIEHLSKVIEVTSDPYIASRYIGFVAVSAVTVYELAIKEIFCSFAEKQHFLLGNFVSSYFARLSGKIGFDNIKNEYLKRFGDEYVKQFDQNLQKSNELILHVKRRSIIENYANVIKWRNKFAHEGEIPTTPTLSEVILAYEDGKEVIHCLSQTLL